MSESSSSLPARPSIEQLRKRAKERLADLRATNPSAKLADAQFAIAREHGFDSWPKLVDHMSVVDPRLAEPQITAPVSRWLGARDVGRTVAFWRDVSVSSRSNALKPATSRCDRAAHGFTSENSMPRQTCRRPARLDRPSCSSTQTMSQRCTPRSRGEADSRAPWRT